MESLPIFSPTGVEDFTPEIGARIGRKARHLVTLEEAGLSVPSWFALLPNLLPQVLNHCGAHDLFHQEIDKVMSLRRDLPAAAPEFARIIRSLKLPLDLKYEISRRLPPKDGHERIFVAVRASAWDDSFSDFESELFVGDGDELFEAVKSIWTRAFSESALRYRLDHGQPLQQLELSVVVQQMIVARAGGQIITADEQGQTPDAFGPDVDTTVIHALPGSGRGLHAGLPADEYRIAKNSQLMDTRLELKRQHLVLNALQGNGLTLEDLPAERQEQSSLSKEEVLTLAKAGQMLENSVGRALQIDFVIDHGGQIFYLQAEPVGFLKSYGPGAGNRLHWKRFRGMAPLEAPVTPLIFSSLQRMFTRGAHAYADMLGVSNSERQRCASSLSGLLGRIQGRVYRRIEAWETLRQHTRGWRRIPNLLMVRARFPFRRRSRQRYEATIESFLEAWEKEHLESLKPLDLLARYSRIEHAMIAAGEAPVLNECYTRYYARKLRLACRHWLEEQDDRICEQLIRPGLDQSDAAQEAEVLLEELNMFRRARFHRFLQNTCNGLEKRRIYLKLGAQLLDAVQQWSQAAGQMFVREGILERPSDVEFLTIGELRGYCLGMAPGTNLQGLADLRRAEYDEFVAAEEPGEELVTFGMVYHQNDFAPPKTGNRESA